MSILDCLNLPSSFPRRCKKSRRPTSRAERAFSHRFSDIASHSQVLESRELLTAGDVWTGFGINGRHDASWYSSYEGTGIDYSVFGDPDQGDLLVQASGRIVAAGGTQIVGLTASGSLDSTFGNNGIVSFFPGIVRALATTSDGRIIAAGNAGGGGNMFAVARYTADGALDTTFSDDGWALLSSGILTSVAVSSSGNVVLAGHASNGTNRDFRVIRLTEAGEFDTTFGGTGIVTTDVRGTEDRANAVVVQSDGKIVVGGSSKHSTTGEPEFAVARYRTDGTLDSTFDANGLKTNAISGFYDEITSLKIQSNGNIVAGGFAQDSNLDRRFALARYRGTDGQLDTSFSGNGIVSIEFTSFFGYYAAITDITIQSDGKIVATGTDSRGDSLAVARLKTDGNLDTTFSGDGKLLQFADQSASVSTVAMASSGQILVTAMTGSSWNCMRLTSTGTLSSSFAGDGVYSRLTSRSGGMKTDGPAFMTLQGDRLYQLTTVNSGTTSSPSFYSQIGAVTESGHPDLSFTAKSVLHDRSYLNGQNLTGLRIRPDGKFQIGRSQLDTFTAGVDWVFRTVDPATGQLGSTLNVPLSSMSDYLNDFEFDQAGNMFAVGVTHNSSDLFTSSTLVKLNLTTGYDTTFSGDGLVSHASLRFKDLAIQSDGKVLVLGETLGADQNLQLLRYLPNGSLDTTFGINGVETIGISTEDEFAADIEIDPAGRLVIGGYSVDTNGDVDFVVVRLLTNGQADATFSGDGLFRFTMGGLDYLSDVLIQPDGRILAAGYQNRPSDDRLAIARITSDGAFDTSFSDDGKLIVNFTSGDERDPTIAVQSNGQLLVAAGQSIGAFVANEAPFIVSGGGTATVNLIVNENSTAVTTVQAADSNGGPFSYHIAGGSDASRFQLNPATGVLSFLPAPDFETPTDSDGNGIYEVAVYASDGWQTSSTQTLRIAISGVPEAPFDLQLSNSTVFENLSIGSLVGTLSSLDQDQGSVHAYSLVTGSGDTNNALFAISGNQLVTAGPIDFETNSTFSIRIQTTDAAGFSFAKSLLITVLNRPDGTSGADVFHLLEIGLQIGPTSGERSARKTDPLH